MCIFLLLVRCCLVYIYCLGSANKKVVSCLILNDAYGAKKWIIFHLEFVAPVDYKTQFIKLLVWLDHLHFEFSVALR